MSGSETPRTGGTAPLAAITGGTGFLGRYIAIALARAGWRLRLLARRDPVHPQTAGLDPELVLGDLNDSGALERFCRGADVVIHAAGLIKARSRAEFFAVNEGGSARLAAAAAHVAPEARLVAISSLAAREPVLSDYAASKCAGEDAIRQEARGPVIVLRPPVLYGPWDRETLALFRIARTGVLPLPRAPEARICFLHVADAATAVATAVEGAIGAGTYELSDPRPGGYDWGEIARAAAGAVGRQPRVVVLPKGAWHGAAALSEAFAHLSRAPAIFTRGKAREILHPDWSSHIERQPPAPIWRAAIDLDQGFSQTAAWYRHHGWLRGGGFPDAFAPGAEDGRHRCG